jgi:branched-chain amino acid transport system substrate-binding protein
MNSAYADAARMAVNEFEKRFARYGYEVRVLNINHGDDDAGAPKAAEEAVKSDAVIAVGFYQSGKALRAAPILIKAGLQLVTPTASAVRLNEMGPLVRTLSISNRQMAQQMVRVAREKVSPKKALIVTETDCEYCVDLTGELKTALTAAGISFSTADITSTATDFSGVLKQVLTEHYDVIVLPNQEASTARLAQFLLSSGVKLPFVGGDAWGNGQAEKFFSVLKDPAFVGYAIGHWSPEKANEHGKAFAKEWLNRFYRNPTNDWAMVYEGTHFVLTEMLEMARDKIPFTRESVAKKIASVREYDGVVSRFVFPGPGSPPQRSVIILKSNTKKKRFDPQDLLWVP